MKKLVIAAMGAALVLTGCDTLRDAMSAHSDVVAKAAGQELTIARASSLLGNSEAPLREDVARVIVNAWVDYHLAGAAAASGDSLTNRKAVEDAMWSMVANIKARKWYEQVSKTWTTPDSTQAEAMYNDNAMLAASHILMLTRDTTPAGIAAVKRRIDGIRAQVTNANFADMARRHSDDGSAPQGGSLGVFGRGAMVPEFDQATAALKPGEISPVIQTQYGYHIIRRPLFSEIRPQFIQAIQAGGTQAAEAEYLENLEKTGKVEIKPGVANAVRAVVDYPAAHTRDRTVLATSTLGKFTAADLARWMETFPPGAQVAERVRSAPDSMLPTFVKNFVRNELVLKSADSAKMIPDSAQMAEVHRAFAATISNVWMSLDIDPASLAEAAKTKEEREALAAQRVEAYLGNLLSQQAPYVDVPAPVQNVLRAKYRNTINRGAIDGLLVEAAKVRLARDSVATAGQPGSIVPVPGQDTAKK